MSRRMRSSLSLRTRFSLVGSCNGAGAGGFCAPINSSSTRQGAPLSCKSVRCVPRRPPRPSDRRPYGRSGRGGTELPVMSYGEGGPRGLRNFRRVRLFSHSPARGKPPLRCPRHAHSAHLFGRYLPSHPLPRSVTVERTHLTPMPSEWLPLRCRSSTTMMMAGVRRLRAFPRSSRTRRTLPSARATALVARPIGLASSSTRAAAVRRH